MIYFKNNYIASKWKPDKGEITNQLITVSYTILGSHQGPAYYCCKIDLYISAIIIWYIQLM